MNFQINGKDVSIGAGKAVRIDHPFVAQVWQAVQMLRGILPLRRVELAMVGAVYDLTITLSDGRVWAQTILEASSDPQVTWNIAKPWRMSEVTALRPLRDAVCMLVATGQVTALVIQVD